MGRLLTRRRAMFLGIGGAAVVVGGGAAGVELVSHGVLPGQSIYDQITGACSINVPKLSYSHPGPSVSGSFESRARNCRVGYTVGYPPGHPVGSPLSLVVMLHGFGGNHTDALAALTPAQAVALQMDGVPVPPMALVTVDGGRLYWNPHPGDNPMAMVVDELIPLCQRMGLGRSPSRVGVMGISMGGYGALLLAEKYPGLFRAVAAISPAVWTSYSQARGVEEDAFDSESDFMADDVVTHAGSLAAMPVRVASGYSDPFHPGVAALVDALPKTAVVELSKGCHDGAFFIEQEPPSVAFLGNHLY
jgi:predicted esterase